MDRKSAAPRVRRGSEIPGPRGGWRLLGRLRRDSIGTLREERERFGDLVRFELPLVSAYLVSDPDLIENILVRDYQVFKKDVLTRELRHVLGAGLLTSEGALWRRQRKIAAPPFAKRAIGSYADAMVAIADSHCRRLVPDAPRDVHRDLMELTLEIVVRTVFGASMPPGSENVGHALDRTMDYFVHTSKSLKRLLPAWLPIPSNLRMHAAVRVLDHAVSSVIADKRRNADPNANDLISLLLRARDEDGKAMSDAQLRDEVVTMFVAGHETTALALSYALLALAEHPHFLARAHAEVDDVLGARPATVADLPKLHYLDMVISETLRLYPPVYIIAREALEPYMLGAYRIARGDQIWIAQLLMHRDSRWFDTPLAFSPDRWDGDLKSRLPRFGYFPFGGGPRVCIGNHFAIMEAVLVLATILQKRTFEVAPDHHLEVEASITMRPVHGVRLIPRAR